MDEDEWSIYLTQDIVVDEILLRLPIKPLFRFKCISKRYESIISDPNFAQKYMQRANSCQKSWCMSGLSSSLLYPFTNENINKELDSSDSILSRVSLPNAPHAPHAILGSSNGLILSLFHPDMSRIKFGLCVSNPLTNVCVQLPPVPITLTGLSQTEVGFATRHASSSSVFLTYKIVIFVTCVGAHDVAAVEDTGLRMEMYSSDTRSWAASRELRSCPRRAYDLGVWKGGFTYRGVLHSLERQMGRVITYDPFDSPDRFGSIQLPKGNHHSRSGLVCSGDQQMLKYCDMSESGLVVTFSVWRLVDSCKGEWCLERKIEMAHFLRFSLKWTHLVAPIPWRRNIIFHPYLIVTLGKCYMMAINSHNGSSRLKEVLLESERLRFFRSCTLLHPLLRIDLCPWSSPL